MRVEPKSDGRRQPLIKWTDLLVLPAWVLAAVLPPAMQVRAARLKGEVLYRLWPGKRRILKAIRAYYAGGSGDAGRIARRYYRYHEQMRVLRRCASRQDFDQISLAVTGEGRLAEAFAAGRGVILLTLHFGYGRLIKHMVRRLGYQAWDVGGQATAAVPTTSRFADFVRGRALRMSNFNAVEHNDLPADINLRPLLKALAANEGLVIPADGSKSSNLVSLPFFGQTLFVSPGPVSIAAQTGAVLLPVFLVDSDGDASRLHLLVGEPVDVVRDGDSKVLEAEALRHFLAQAEAVFTSYPHLYQWRRLRPKSKTARSQATEYLRRLEASRSGEVGPEHP